MTLPVSAKVKMKKREACRITMAVLGAEQAVCKEVSRREKSPSVTSLSVGLGVLVMAEFPKNVLSFKINKCKAQPPLPLHACYKPKHQDQRVTMPRLPSLYS